MLPSEIIKKNLICDKMIKDAIQALPDARMTETMQLWLKGLKGNTRRSEAFIKKNKGRVAGSKEFDGWWKLFPKQNGRKEALEMWNVKKFNESQLEEIMVGTKALNRMCVADKERAKYVKEGRRWLEKERWLDGELDKYKEKVKLSESRACEICKESVDKLKKINVRPRMAFFVCSECEKFNNWKIEDIKNDRKGTE